MKKLIMIFITILLLQETCVFAEQTKKNIDGITYFEEAKFKKNEINKSFYYLRHGETDSNKKGFAHGRSDAPLNAEGILQVEKAVKLLQDKNIKIIIASPKLRTKQTAEIINKHLNVQIIYNDGLIEGGWKQLLPNKNLNKKNDNEKIWKNGDIVAGAESLYSFQIRIHDTIKDIVNKYDNILIIGHGRYFRYLTTLLNEETINSDNAIPFYFLPILEATGSKLYNIDVVEQHKE